MQAVHFRTYSRDSIAPVNVDKNTVCTLNRLVACLKSIRFGSAGDATDRQRHDDLVFGFASMVMLSNVYFGQRIKPRNRDW